MQYLNGRFVASTGWAFNNLTYAASPRELWKGNPIAGNGVVGAAVSWTAKDGRKWRTECDTATTGRGGCRSYIEASVIAKTARGYEWRTQWILNNMVRFSAPKPVNVLAGITDPALRQCVVDALGGNAPETLRHLWCEGKGIESLAGIGVLKGLKVLSVDGNDIDDLSPLAGLQLNQLSFNNNLVEDLSPLAGMTDLWHVVGVSNFVFDLSPLENAPLYTLDLTGNEVDDLSPLAGKNTLYALSLTSNWIYDLSPLAGLTQLRSLSLYDNYVTDLTPLAGLSSLEGLSLGYNIVDDVTPLAGLTNLEMLELQSNFLGDVAPLKGLTNLKMLTLADNEEILNLDQLEPLVAAGCVIDIWPTD